MAGDERDPPRDPLETLQLDPEDLARLRDLSAPSDASPRAPQLSIPFELTQAPAVPLRQLLSSKPPRRSPFGWRLACLLALLVVTAITAYVLWRLGVFRLDLP